MANIHTAASCAAVLPSAICPHPGALPIYQYRGLNADEVHRLGFRARPSVSDGLVIRKVGNGRYDVFAVADRVIEQDAAFDRLMALVLASEVNHE